MDNTINSYVSRYIIPFYFNYEDDGYNNIVNKFLNEEKDFKAYGCHKDCKWIKKGFWKNNKSNQSEMDIYTYLLELIGEEESKTESNLGTSLVLKTETDDTFLDLQYVNKEKQIKVNFECNNIGVLLFRNGIGFVWYGIEFAGAISTDEYIEFQFDFKELTRTNSDKFRKKTDRDTYDSFCMGKWLAQLLDTSELGIKFWEERKSKIVGDNTEGLLPNKALLIQYLFIKSAKNKERIDLAFRIANGYDAKYNAPSTLASQVYEPFGNTCFYTSIGGIAYVVSDDETDAAFFENSFKERFIGDYFFIYVLLLYQKYSCAHYSWMLTKLPADVKSIEKDENHVNRIEDLDTQINLFLVKSTYESVSNIHHQNGAYIYSKKELRIEEDMKSLTAGLASLRDIEEEKQKDIEQEKVDKKDRALNNGLIIFGFMVVLSAAVDAVNLIDWFYNEQTVINVWHIVVLSLIALLTVFMFIVFVVNTRRKK